MIPNHGDCFQNIEYRVQDFAWVMKLTLVRKKSPGRLASKKACDEWLSTPNETILDVNSLGHQVYNSLGCLYPLIGLVGVAFCGVATFSACPNCMCVYVCVLRCACF
ncbi:hypothetical protein P153DRAFT_151050 [Dothidotthia symphoricarpi CBS 119687]|uniref:Uncharacterized protein n=1 Tax=Dothidotthia symphoricarpi CBS 119687 TaxID=1392245 RepID=A0A6A6AQA5_9PLEO|nr:uncharacterized protein P153DRAFT_151050 [Dothidotthia symphoricarpi CBS 119687]KAF2133195.1 hypothetical protein P153DRAFT_151050 [Dothidotthia symphoricarpi CBS 119687]